MVLVGCGSSSNGMTPDAPAPVPDAPLVEVTFRVFDQVPQFGIYNSTDPNYTPPAGITMWSHGTVFVTKLTAAQRAQIGDQLAARITYHAQCDNAIGSSNWRSCACRMRPRPTR